MSLYLPPHYDSSKDYPLVFLLSGWGSSSEKWTTNHSSFGHSLPELLEREIMAGNLKDCLVAFPDGRTRLGHSQYINSPANGNFMDYIADDCVRAVESFTQSSFKAESCVIAGHSSGGYGALRMGMQRPDRFAYVCSVAGDGFFELSIKPQLLACVIELGHAGSIEKLIESSLADPDPGSWGGNRFKALMTLCLASCYSPNLKSNNSLYGDLFFDLHTGEINQEVWKQWKSHDPLELIDKNISQLKKLKWILLDCGQSDEYFAQLAHRQIEKQFLKHEIKNFDCWEYKGRHSGQHYRFIDRIKHLLNKME